MGDKYAYEDVRVVVQHMPDHSLEALPNGTRESVELPGTYMLGVEIDGAFFPIGPIQGGALHKRVALAQEAQEKQQSGDGGAQTDASYSEREQDLQRQLDDATAQLREQEGRRAGAEGREESQQQTGQPPAPQ